MKRGDLWIAAAGAVFASKPAPFLIVQRDNLISQRDSVMVCRLTSQVDQLSLMRPLLAPSTANGLKTASRVQVDKVMTLKKSSLTKHIGAIDADEMKQIDDSIRYWLGI